jgi:hypothetical protein
LYFLAPAGNTENPATIAPRLKEYPVTLRVRENSPDGPELPTEELKIKMGLEVKRHLSWVIPSFSQKIFLSLSKETLIHEFGGRKSAQSPFEELFPDYTSGSAEPLIAPALTVNRQMIGMMEVFSYKNKKMKCSLTLYDQPYRVQIQEELPLEQWVVLDTPGEVVVFYISPL